MYPDKFKSYRENLRRLYEQAKDRNDREEKILELSYLCLSTLVHRLNLGYDPAWDSATRLFQSAETNPENLPKSVFELTDLVVEKVNEIFDGIN